MKSLLILASMTFVLFLAASHGAVAQNVAAVKTLEGTVVGYDGTEYWTGLKIESGGKEYIFASRYNAGQGTNPTIVGKNCCEIGTRVRVTYKGSTSWYLLDVTRIVVLGRMPSIVGGQLSTQIFPRLTVPSGAPEKPEANPRPIQTPRPTPAVERGFAGDWSDGTSWLMIIRDGDKISAIYPSAKSPQVMSGSLQPGGQLRLTNNNTGRYFSPYENYEGDFSRGAIAELGVDRNLLTVRFSEARDGRSIVMRRMPQKPPVRGAGVKNLQWASVSVAGTSSCAVTTTGVPYCWGGGYDRVFDSNGAGLVIGLEDQSITIVSTGISSACWVATSGTTHCSGSNGNSILGSGTKEHSSVPVSVVGGLKFSIVSIGETHACALATTGKAYCWGNNMYEQLGNAGKVPTMDNIYTGPGTSESASPFPVSGGLYFVSLSAGSNHTCAVTSDGTAYCWGFNGSGQLGFGLVERRRAIDPMGIASPVAVAGGFKFKSVSASRGSLGNSFTCGLITNGAAYCWGVGNNHELGSLDTNDSPVPVPVHGGLTFSSLSAGSQHVCGVTNSGDAYCWGDNKWGQLGTGTSKAALTPLPVSGSLKFASISSGSSNTCGVTISGELYCWGTNGYGQLGVSTKIRSSPVPVAVQMQTDEDGFKAFFREFGAAVRRRDRVAVESFMSPAIVFPVDIRSTSMAFDYLDYDGGKGWEWLEQEVFSGAKPYKDSEPRPIARITNDKNVIFGRGSDERWRWLRFGRARFND